MRTLRTAAGLLAASLTCALFGFLGCATHPPPLPAVLPSDLPGGYLDPLSRAPCSGPFRARLRLRVAAEGEPALTAGGSLDAALPRVLRLQAKVGAFRPLFALFAGPDSCEILFHESARYWIVPADAPDWRRMDPAAWAQALRWLLCPAELYARLEPSGPGRVVEDVWEVEGGIRGLTDRVELALDRRYGSLRRLRVVSPGGEIRLEANLSRYEKRGEAWLPRLIAFRMPASGLRLGVEVTGLRSISSEEIPPRPLVLPASWRRIRAGDPVPELGAP